MSCLRIAYRTAPWISLTNEIDGSSFSNRLMRTTSSGSATNSCSPRRCCDCTISQRASTQHTAPTLLYSRCSLCYMPHTHKRAHWSAFESSPSFDGSRREESRSSSSYRDGRSSSRQGIERGGQVWRVRHRGRCRGRQQDRRQRRSTHEHQSIEVLLLTLSQRLHQCICSRQALGAHTSVVTVIREWRGWQQRGRRRARSPSWSARLECRSRSRSIA